MRSYRIYWIEDEFATFFYGREKVFFTLFYEWELTVGSLHEIVQKQVHYITKTIPFLQIQRMVHNELLKKGIESKISDQIILEDNDGQNGAKMSIHERFIKIDSWGLDRYESIFFEILRKNAGRFLAIDIKNEQFGWLKPIKQRKYV